MGKSQKYEQVKSMLLNLEVDITALPKGQNNKLFEKFKSHLPEHIYNLVIQVVNDLYAEELK